MAALATLANDGNSIRTIVTRTTDGGFMLRQDNDLVYLSPVQMAALVAVLKKVA